MNIRIHILISMALIVLMGCGDTVYEVYYVTEPETTQTDTTTEDGTDTSENQQFETTAGSTETEIAQVGGNTPNTTDSGSNTTDGDDNLTVAQDTGTGSNTTPAVPADPGVNPATPALPAQAQGNPSGGSGGNVDSGGNGGYCDDGGFVGTWPNVNSATRSITKVVITADCVEFTIHMWGSCSPTDCDWGTITTPLSNADDGILQVFWNQGFATRTQELTLIDANTLELYSFSHYLDDSGRQDRDTTQYYYRQ